MDDRTFMSEMDMEEEQADMESLPLEEPTPESSDFEHESENESEEETLPAKITVLKDGETLQEFVIETLPFNIGRKSDNHVVLDEKNVSRKHAEIVMTDDRYMIRDLGSTGGTLVNGNPVNELDIHTGDMIGIGNFQLRFDSGDPEDERTVFDADEGTVIEEDGTALDEDRTRFYEEPEATLVIIQSENLEENVHLTDEEVVLGREEDADIVIDDQRVSRKHCKIALTDGRYVLTDLGSSNGTFINGQKVTEKDLENGDKIQIGNTILQFEIAKPFGASKASSSAVLFRIAAGVAALAVLAFAASRFISGSSPKPVKVILQKTWETSVSSAVVASPSLGDLNGDGYLNLAVADVGGTVYGLDARHGGLIWNTPFKSGGGPLTASLLPVDINKQDGSLDVILATATKGVLALDGDNRNPIWTAQTGTAVPATPKAADINDDGTQDVFITSASGQVKCLDGRQGGPFWVHELQTAVRTAPVLADLNGDGIKDVVIGGTNHKLSVLDGRNGQPLWAYVGTEPPSTAACGDINGDKHPDVALVTSDQIIALEGRKGTVLWKWSLPRTARPTPQDPFRTDPPALADLNGDGVPDVVASTSGGHVYAVDGASAGLTYIWDYSLSASRKTAPALADLNNDGTSDVVVGDREGYVLVIDGKTGHQLNRIHVGGPVETMPVIGDFTADGTVDIAVGTRSGQVVAVSTETPVKKNRILWNAF